MTGPDATIDEIELAARLIDEFDVQRPWELRVELIAYRKGATVVYRPSTTADARVVRAGDEAFLAVAEAARGTPRGRFSIAHELGHYLLHADTDALARVHDRGRRSARDFQFEAEANRFAAHLLVPTKLAAPYCRVSPPTLDAVGVMARLFDVSLTVACQRWTELSGAPCALVEAVDGKVRRVLSSPTFRGAAARGRTLEVGTLARSLRAGDDPTGERVHDRAWGSGGGVHIVEACAPLSDRAVLIWLWHG